MFSISDFLRPPLLQVDIKSFPAVVPTFGSVRRMELSTFIFFIGTEQEGETAVMALALR